MVTFWASRQICILGRHSSTQYLPKEWIFQGSPQHRCENMPLDVLYHGLNMAAMAPITGSMLTAGWRLSVRRGEETSCNSVIFMYLLFRNHSLIHEKSILEVPQKIARLGELLWQVLSSDSLLFIYSYYWFSHGMVSLEKKHAKYSLKRTLV